MPTPTPTPPAAGSTAFGLTAEWQGCLLRLAWRQAAASEAVFETVGLVRVRTLTLTLTLTLALTLTLTLTRWGRGASGW